MEPAKENTSGEILPPPAQGSPTDSYLPVRRQRAAVLIQLELGIVTR